MPSPNPSPDPNQTTDFLQRSTVEPQTIDVSQPEQSTNGPVSKGPVNTPAIGPAISGYRITGEIAKGGMGCVYAAHDLTLDREVAIKTLLAGANGERFITEAKITAKLPHPNIPPVHALGTLDHGTPWLAMKLIRGRTLAELLKERPSPQADLPRFIQIFEQIAHAVGFAHSRHIIHRDLKPLNVMVGEFGEVQVMDWGLAKDLASHRHESVGSDLASHGHASVGSPSDNVHNTTAGAIMGTPSYMAPEQARGEVVDQRADVFALGSILAAILTGKPAFVGTSIVETITKAADGDTREVLARLAGCGAEPDLLAIAKQCLAANASERPADALAVAKLVADYRQNVETRLKQAETERTAAEVRATETRKRQRALAWSGGALAVVLLTGLGASLWQMNRAIDAESMAKTNEDTAKRNEDEARQNADRANAKTKEVEETLVIVQQRTKLAMDAYGDFVFGIQNQLANRPDTQDLRRALLEKARTGLAKILDDARKQGTPDSTLVWSHFRMGDVELQLGNTQAARLEYQTGHGIAKRLAEAKPNDTSAQRDLSISYDKLGDLSKKVGQKSEALSYYQKSLEIRLRLVEADPKNTHAQRDLSTSYDNLGDVLLQLDQKKEPLVFYLTPSNPFSQSQLIMEQRKKGLAYYLKSLAIRVRLAEDDPTNTQVQRELSISYGNLGDVYMKVGQRNEAFSYYQKCLEIIQRQMETDPKNVQTQRDLSISYGKLGDASDQLGKTQEAFAFYEKSQKLRVQLVEADPKNAQAQRDLSLSYNHLGDMSLKLGQTQEAMAYYQMSLDIRLKLVETDPKNAQAQRDLSLSFDNLGDVSKKMGQTQNALMFYQKSLEIRAQLAEANTKNAQPHSDLFVSYWKLGSTYKSLHNYEFAIKYFTNGRAVMLPWHSKGQLVGQFKNAVPVMDREIASCRIAEKAIADIEFIFQQPTVEIPILLSLRAQALLKRDKPTEAVTTVERFAAWAEIQETNRDEQRYNAARVFALCAAAIEKDREKLLDRSLTLLRQVKVDGYFNQAKIAQLNKDADFDGVRAHPKFGAFAKELEAAREITPPPKGK